MIISTQFYTKYVQLAAANCSAQARLIYTKYVGLYTASGTPDPPGPDPI